MQLKMHLALVFVQWFQRPKYELSHVSEAFEHFLPVRWDQFAGQTTHRQDWLHSTSFPCEQGTGWVALMPPASDPHDQAGAVWLLGLSRHLHQWAPWCGCSYQHSLAYLQGIVPLEWRVIAHNSRKTDLHGETEGLWDTISFPTLVSNCTHLIPKDKIAGTAAVTRP